MKGQSAGLTGRGDCGIESPRVSPGGRMGLLAGGLGGWASGGRWGEVVLRITGESGFDGSMGFMWAMVSTALGRLGALVNGAAGF